MNELDRQLFHIDLGLLLVLFFAFFGSTSTLCLLSLSILLGSLLIHMKLRNSRLPLIDWFLGKFERSGEAPGYGSLWYMVGFLLLFSLLQNPSQLAASSLILAVGDGLSTLAGRRFGRNPLPYNRKKTLEGSAAFFLSSSLLAFPFLGTNAIVLAFLATIGESISLGVDDNLTVPALCILFLKSVG